VIVANDNRTLEADCPTGQGQFLVFIEHRVLRRLADGGVGTAVGRHHLVSLQEASHKKLSLEIQIEGLGVSNYV